MIVPCRHIHYVTEPHAEHHVVLLEEADRMENRIYIVRDAQGHDEFFTGEELLSVGEIARKEKAREAR